MLQRKWRTPKFNSSELDAHHLHSESQSSYEQEQRVVEEASENIELVVTQLTRVDLVEDLHKNKCLEQHRVDDCFVGIRVQRESRVRVVVLPALSVVKGISFFVRQVENVFAFEKEQQQNCYLVKCLPEHVSPHYFVYNFLGLAHWLPAKQLIAWRLCRESKSSKGVHN